MAAAVLARTSGSRKRTRTRGCCGSRTDRTRCTIGPWRASSSRNISNAPLEPTLQKQPYRPGFLSELFRLDGRVALVTGGHGELAEAIAATLADLGCDLVLAARKEAE